MISDELRAKLIQAMKEGNEKRKQDDEIIDCIMIELLESIFQRRPFVVPARFRDNG